MSLLFKYLLEFISSLKIKPTYTSRTMSIVHVSILVVVHKDIIIHYTKCLKVIKDKKYKFLFAHIVTLVTYTRTCRS